ncbi:MAG TPA: zf-HC2 domain-containing protein [Capsulimonadaceae bacterium]
MKRTQCNSFRPMISEYLDNSLSADKMWKVQMHLSICPDCAKLAESLSETVTLIRQLPAQTLSPSFDTNLASRIAEAAKQKQQLARAPWVIRAARQVSTAFSTDSIIYSRKYRLTAPVALATAMLGVALLLSSPSQVAPPETHAVAPDSAFATACMHQNHTYISGQPFADPSAQALLQRQADDHLRRDGAALLGSENI